MIFFTLASDRIFAIQSS